MKKKEKNQILMKKGVFLLRGLVSKCPFKILV